MIVLHKLKGKKSEKNKCKFAFKLKYFVVSVVSSMTGINKRYNVTYLSGTIANHLSLYYLYYHVLMICLGYYHISGRLLLSDFIIWLFFRPVRDVYVAFVIRQVGALWRISELLSQLIFSMRSGMFFLDFNSEYVVGLLYKNN